MVKEREVGREGIEGIERDRVFEFVLGRFRGR